MFLRIEVSNEGMQPTPKRIPEGFGLITSPTWCWNTLSLNAAVRLSVGSCQNPVPDQGDFVTLSPDTPMME